MPFRKHPPIQVRRYAQLALQGEPLDVVVVTTKMLCHKQRGVISWECDVTSPEQDETFETLWAATDEGWPAGYLLTKTSGMILRALGRAHFPGDRWGTVDER